MMHTAFRSVKLDGITELASTSTIQHKHAGRDLRVWPQSTGVTSHWLRATTTRWSKWCWGTWIPLSEDDVFSPVCRAISILPKYQLNNISFAVDIKHETRTQNVTRGRTHSITCANPPHIYTHLYLHYCLIHTNFLNLVSLDHLALASPAYRNTSRIAVLTHPKTCTCKYSCCPSACL